MSTLDQRIEHLLYQEKLASANDKVRSVLRRDPSIKVASMDGPPSWLDRFQGTPLFAEALKLERASLEQEAAREQVSAQRMQESQVENQSSDQVRMQKKMLELQLAEMQEATQVADQQLQAAAATHTNVVKSASFSASVDGAVNSLKKGLSNNRLIVHGAGLGALGGAAVGAVNASGHYNPVTGHRESATLGERISGGLKGGLTGAALGGAAGAALNANRTGNWYNKGGGGGTAAVGEQAAEAATVVKKTKRLKKQPEAVTPEAAPPPPPGAFGGFAKTSSKKGEYPVSFLTDRIKKIASALPTSFNIKSLGGGGIPSASSLGNLRSVKNPGLSATRASIGAKNGFSVSDHAPTTYPVPAPKPGSTATAPAKRLAVPLPTPAPTGVPNFAKTGAVLDILNSTSDGKTAAVAAILSDFMFKQAGVDGAMVGALLGGALGNTVGSIHGLVADTTDAQGKKAKGGFREYVLDGMKGALIGAAGGGLIGGVLHRH